MHCVDLTFLDVFWPSSLTWLVSGSKGDQSVNSTSTSLAIHKSLLMGSDYCLWGLPCLQKSKQVKHRSK